MFDAFIITLREGVEAALVIAIALSLLRRRGQESLTGALFGGAALAVLASVGVAALATRVTWNQELAEGAALLVGAGLVAGLVVWMWRAAPRMTQEIESGIARATAAGRGAAGAGLFLFAFGMVFREGLETAVFLSAAGFNSQGVSMWLGALVGLLVAVAFGVLFARGAIRVPLKPFFSLTSAVLLLIALQLLVGGLHELSEAELLPSSRAEMALIGPIVKNELLLFTLTVALAAGWLLFGPGFRGAPAAAPATGEGPRARLARAAAAGETARRRWTGIVGLVVVGFLASAFVQQSRLPGMEPAQPLALEGGEAKLDAAPLADGRLHFFEAVLPDSQRARFFAIQVGSELKTCMDACEICGPQGYFQDGRNVICRNCVSPIVLTSIGRPGGCNPIPIPHRLEGGRVALRAADLGAALPRAWGR